MNIYMAGPLGFEAAKKIFEENREALAERFPGFFIRGFEAIAEECLQLKETECDEEVFIKEIREGGLFAVLWAMAAEKNCGVTVDIKRVPLHQEIIEIDELFGENPYEAESRGCYVIFSESRDFLPGEIKPALIGKTGSEKARKVLSGDACRYLSPPARQQKDIANRKMHTEKTFH